MGNAKEIGKHILACVQEQEVFEYLDELRESGVTNMFGATPYIVDAFDLDQKTARDLLCKWMKTFGERHPEE